MKVLLDTHIWLWSLMEPDRLGKRLSATLKDSESELWLSPVSVWELSMLVEKRRITLAITFDRWLAKAFEIAPLKEASLTFAVAQETRRLKLPHRDPADRFLAATARVHGLKLATADARLLEAKTVPTLANV